MSLLELKNNIHKLTVETEDTSILAQVEAYFQYLISGKDWWDGISEKEKKQINIGRQELKAGKGISHQEVQQEVKNLFAKFQK